MGEHLKAHLGTAVLIKKGEAIPENAIAMTDTEVLEIQQKRIANFKPEKEMRVFHYGPMVASGTVALSGAVMNQVLRTNFRLGGLRRMFTFVPTVFVSGMLGAGVHEAKVKTRILLGKENCVTCISLRSGFYQVLMGVAYTFTVGILTCIPSAREYYTLPMPASKDGRGFLRLLGKIRPKSSILLLLTLNNMLLGMWLAKRELEVFYTHLNKPPTISEIPVDLHQPQ